MLHKTKGIVFRYVKYRETSIITTIFTEEFGVQSYIINGIRSAKSKKSIAAFAPLSLLDLVAYQKTNADVQRLSDWKRSVVLTDIFTNVEKSTIAMFLSEVLYKCIKEREPARDLFDFVYHSIDWLDKSENSIADFHLQFLIKLTRYLGFGIDHYVGEDSISALQKLGKIPYGSSLDLSRAERFKNLELVLLFYKEHLEGFGSIKSLAVLREVFDD